MRLLPRCGVCELGGGVKPTILVIEDNPLAADLIGYQLGREEYDIRVALNGVEGLNMARANPPDLILLDLMLPGLDGFEVLNRLRADPRTADVPVVIVSAKSQPTDKQMAARVGADAYLTKTYRRAELQQVVRSMLRRRSGEEVLRGTCVGLIAPHGGQAARVALYTGLALTGQGRATTVVDLRPFSIAHSLMLDVPPRPDLASFSDPGTASRLSGLTVQHSSGLRLLNNLAGSGEAGQFTTGDVLAMISALLRTEGFVLADAPIYPVDVLRQVAHHCALVLLVTPGDTASLRAARSALAMIQQAHVDTDRLGLVLLGQPSEEPDAVLGQPVLGVLPPEAEAGDPAFHALAGRLLSLT